MRIDQPHGRIADATTPAAFGYHPLGAPLLARLNAAYATRSVIAVSRLAQKWGFPAERIPHGASVDSAWRTVIVWAAPAGTLPNVLAGVYADPRVADHHKRIHTLAEWDYDARIEAYLSRYLDRVDGAGHDIRHEHYVDLSAIDAGRSLARPAELKDYLGVDLPRITERIFRAFRKSRRRTPPAPPRPVATRAGWLEPHVIDRLQHGTRSVVLGEAGSGKTWTLRRVLGAAGDAWRSGSRTARDWLPVPVWVPLRDFSGMRSSPDSHAEPQPFRDFPTDCFHELAPIHDILIRGRCVLLLLDAFDELPQRGADGRDLRREVLDALNGVQRFVLSCRADDYRNELAGFPGVTHLELLPLDPTQIQAAIGRRFSGAETPSAQALWADIGGTPALISAGEKAFASGDHTPFWEPRTAAPKGTTAATTTMAASSSAPTTTTVSPDYSSAEQVAIRSARQADSLMRLARSPIRMSWLTEIHDAGGSIPPDRAALRRALIDHRLASSQQDQQHQPPAETGRTGSEARDLVQRTVVALHDIALLMQQVQRPVIARAVVRERLGDSAAEELIATAVGANLLTEQAGELAFEHGLLQGHFAALTLLPLLERDEPPREIFAAGEGWWDPHVWREAFHLLAELEAAGEPGRLRVAHWLASISPETALDIVTACDESPGAYKDLPPTLQAALVAAARAKLDEPHPHGRAAAYRVLGRLGADDRAGVGVGVTRTAEGLSLPDITWCEVPAGACLYQDDPLRHVLAFHIARYPITWSQFQAFVDDPSGYRDPTWWTAGPKAPPAAPLAAHWPIGNHPRDSVSWYEAMAFCAWLAERLRAQGELADDEQIRLPTEVEWEKAARGEGGREYPWPQGATAAKSVSAYLPGSANTDETGDFAGQTVGALRLGRTSAVGAYPASRTTYGAFDMAGNLWEWCTGCYDPALPGIVARVVRGGSWATGHRSAGASFRDWGLPGLRSPNEGFRVVRTAHDAPDLAAEVVPIPDLSTLLPEALIPRWHEVPDDISGMHPR
jgi:formylglycine-generating enzyme required for sulfatase activity